jgi:predicted phosphodiesterase
LTILVIADVHANLPALEAVLQAAGSVDEIWCLGDLVGYGPSPNEVVERLRELGVRSLAGNHDWGSIGKADLAMFNDDARAACSWTARVLSEENRKYLAGLQTAGTFRDVSVAHGSPQDPAWEYITNSRVAMANFGHFSADLCLVGHTHVPLVFRWCRAATGADAFTTEVPVNNRDILVQDDRLIANPGSVGQPRDGDPRAAFALFDPDARTIHVERANYDVGEVQRLMAAVGLPDRLALRIQYGW